ncbi:hypothetical protein NDU88_007598 [Pleurodeles waltl]|uniref:Uncharacterized protein n=1 Tax=Pleurodeles waltl TaxID=8319 RepID=A0AAV7NTR5_PLEWA|nr:hypothetical protein NDU88_007598 [Pleurodeles waltl]
MNACRCPAASSELQGGSDSICQPRLLFDPGASYCAHALPRQLWRIQRVQRGERSRSAKELRYAFQRETMLPPAMFPHPINGPYVNLNINCR